MTPASRDREDQPHPPQHGPLALAAARPRRANISSSTCPASTRRWSRTASTAGSSGRSPAAIKTPTPQLTATAVGVILNPVVGSAQEHREGSRGQEGLRPGQGRGRQGPALAPAAGADQRARPAQVRDAQLEGDLPARHQRPQPLQQPDRARSATAASAPSISSTSRPSCSATTAANGRRTRSRRRSTARRPCRPIS